MLGRDKMAAFIQTTFPNTFSCMKRFVIQIKIGAEYRDMLPRPRLVCQEPGLRPIGRSPGVPVKSSRGLGSMSRYSAQILICFIAYIFPFFCLFLCGFGWELCRTTIIHSASYTVWMKFLSMGSFKYKNTSEWRVFAYL